MNPYSGYNVTCGWTCHTSRTPPSPGGIDRGMPKGTALVVPPGYDGVVSFTPLNGSLGHTVTIRLDRPDANGAVKIQFAHCSQFVGANGRHVVSGEVVARSGGVKGEAGSGTSTGPHLHAHGINAAGKRVPPAYETGSSTAGGGGVTPITERKHMSSASVVWDGQATAGVARFAVVNLAPGVPWYETKDRAYAERFAASIGQTIFDCGSSAEFDYMKSCVLRPASVASSGGSSGGGSSAPSASENAEAVAAKLAPSFEAIPTATENGDAARAAIVK